MFSDFKLLNSREVPRANRRKRKGSMTNGSEPRVLERYGCRFSAIQAPYAIVRTESNWVAISSVHKYMAG